MDSRQVIIHYRMCWTQSMGLEVRSIIRFQVFCQVGVGCGIGFRMVVYYKAKNANKFQQGVEYGSARWGTVKDIEPYVDSVF